MTAYKNTEKAMIESAKDFFIEHSTKKMADRLVAGIPEVLNFYHDSGIIISPEQHAMMWDILKKAKGGATVRTHDEVSEKVQDKKEKALIKAQEEKKQNALAKEKEAAEAIIAKVKEEQAALIAEKEAEIKALEEKKLRIEGQVKEVKEA